jgi:transcriptional regulator with XRE-family HTH domain
MSDIRKKIGARLKSCRTAKGWTFNETAAYLSTTSGQKIIPSRYGNWELAINTPPLEMLIALGALFGKPPAYLGAISDDDGTAPEAGRFTVPALSTIPTASGTADLGEDFYAPRITWLDEIKLDKGRMLLMSAPDDSMGGVIEQGDPVMLDLSVTNVTRDDIFAIMVGDRPWLRWIKQQLDGTYSIQAEARDHYPDQVMTPGELAKLRILGRVKLITHIR